MNAPRILILDDEESLVDALMRHFERRGYEPTGAYLVGEAEKAIDESLKAQRPFAAIVTDLQLPDGDGRTIVKLAREKLPRTPVVVMTGSRSVSGAAESMRLGAITVLEKPVPLDALESEVKQAIADRGELDDALNAASRAGIVGNSAAIRAVLDVILLAAPTDATVLIEGETGTGKELVAQALHRLSRRAKGPLVAVNCAALPENLLESELFGHVKGAFTGASESRIGRFRQAEGGTLFLDEIGEMPVGVQAKLLRTLQQNEVQPVGADKAVKVDARVIAATNRDLEKAVADGKFRADLYYRLNVVPLELPPLRDRPEDIPTLAAHFLRGKNRRLSPQALEALQRHSWPGNVRELQNLLERLAVLRPEGELQLMDLPVEIRSVPATAEAVVSKSLPPEGVDLYAVLAEVEDRLIHEALDRAQGNRNQAAQYLGLNRTTLVEKIKRMTRRGGST
jgi:DNA-binding NtrC family response regulator